MSVINFYLAGVGGQGIGLLAAILVRAIDHAGIPVKSVDTHGLAQRGGSVVSHVRMGEGAHSPLIGHHQAHIVLALEITEAMRAAIAMARPSGTLFYYRTLWQPLSVRLGKEKPVEPADLQAYCSSRQIHCVEVFDEALPDSRMQNTALLASLCKRRLIEDIKADHYTRAMEDLMEGKALEKNREWFLSRAT